MANKEFTELLKAAPPEPQVEQPSKMMSALLAAKEIAGAVWDGAVPMAEHGATELMSAAYTGNSYVPYGWSNATEGQEVTGQDGPLHGLPQKEQENDGREM